MFRLVAVGPEDVDVLFSLVALSPETEHKQHLMAGLRHLSEHYKTDPTPTRMVLTHAMHQSIYNILIGPFLPADADRMGIPTADYLYMSSRLPALQLAFATPDLWDPRAAGLKTETTKTFLN